ncbi:MAG: hypothetical protein LBC99_11020 [Spirochaetota bacterium]|jgi:hypothetical protein|nr:hypothetical protein [Spirochaetota bacterium]
MRTAKLVVCVFLAVCVSGTLFASLFSEFKPEVSAYFNNYIYGFNNGDLRSLDETSMSAVEATDDKLFLGYLEVGGTLDVTVVKNIRFYFDVYRVGFWGNDSPEYVAANPIYFRHVFFSLPLVGDLSATVGRFTYALNTDRTHHNYVLSDIVDAVLLRYGKEESVFGIDLFADLFSMNAPIDAVYELHASRHDNVTHGFNGDVNIIRFVLAPVLRPVYNEDTKIIFKPFAMFSRVGATGKPDGSMGGNNQTIAGASGNYADNDWLGLGGLTIYARMGGFSAYLEFAYSMGKDRTQDLLPDVDISGFMGHASLAYNFGDVGAVTLGAVFSKGAETDLEGNYTSYGHVGFKADKAGGWLFRDYYGVYPYTILGARGITIEPTEAAKRSPMAAATLRLDIDSFDPIKFQKAEDGIDITVEFWAFVDTSTSNADFTSDSLGVDKFDQRRFGQFMGWELDVGLAYSVYHNLLTVGVNGAIFVPGKFFTHPVTDTRSPSGNSTFFGVQVYTALRI